MMQVTILTRDKDEDEGQMPKCKYCGYRHHELDGCAMKSPQDEIDELNVPKQTGDTE